jgi:hypothetical protein
MSLITKYVFRGDCTITDIIGDKAVIEGPCVMSGRTVKVVVKSADLARYKAGEFVQDCFPYLNAAEREFLISGISGEAWTEMFPAEDEDDDGED